MKRGQTCSSNANFYTSSTREISSTVAGGSESPSELPVIAKKFAAIVVTAHEKLLTKVPLWLGTSIKEGKTQDLLALKASTKAGLGSAVQEILAGLEILEKLENKSGVWGQEKLTGKADAKNAMVSLTQLASLQSEQFRCCMPDIDQRVCDAKEKVASFVRLLEKETDWNKGQVLDFHDKFSVIPRRLESWDFKDCMDLLDNTESENGKQIEKEMAAAIPCQVLSF